MSTEVIVLIVVAVAIVISATSPYWRPNGEAPPALNLGGVANTLLYVILVIFLVKVLLGLHPL